MYQDHICLKSHVSRQQWTPGLSMPRFPAADWTGLLCSSVSMLKPPVCLGPHYHFCLGTIHALLAKGEERKHWGTNGFKWVGLNCQGPCSGPLGLFSLTWQASNWLCRVYSQVGRCYNHHIALKHNCLLTQNVCSKWFACTHNLKYFMYFLHMI